MKRPQSSLTEKLQSYYINPELNQANHRYTLYPYLHIKAKHAACDLLKIYPLSNARADNPTLRDKDKSVEYT